MRNLILWALLCASVLLSACNGGTSNLPTTGSISGDVDVVGPINGAVELSVGVFAPGSETPVQTTVAGRVTSAATATLTGRTIAFSFTELPYGTYEVGVYAVSGQDTTFYWRSAAVAVTESDPTADGVEGSLSFTGAAPFGTVSGVALLADGFEWPAAPELAFIGLSPVSNPQGALQYIVDADDASDGSLYFNLDGVAYGQWLIGLYRYNPTTHAVTPLGLLDDPVVVNGAAPNVTGAIFAADSAGDPGADPTLGSISGTVSFNGDLPSGLAFFVAANTIPPQQGAPPSTQEVTAAAVGDDNSFDYTLPLLPEGEYSVSIFAYNFVTHQATYFGEATGTHTLAAEDHLADIDFDADVTLVGGTAE